MGENTGDKKFSIRPLTPRERRRDLIRVVILGFVAMCGIAYWLCTTDESLLKVWKAILWSAKLFGLSVLSTLVGLVLWTLVGVFFRDI